jgi:CSLREA domain-containing protein
MLQVRFLNRMAIAVVLALGALIALAPAALAAPFSVDMTGDASDSNPGDGACRNSFQRCSLRAAVQESNVLPGTDTAQVPFGNFALTLGSSPALATILTVDMIGDAVDADPGDGACRTSSGKCSVRAAIQESNALHGPELVSVPAGTYTLTIEEPVDPSVPPDPPPPPPGYPQYPYPEYPEWPEPPEPPEWPEYPEPPEPPEPPEWPEWPEPVEPIDPEDLLPEEPFKGVDHYFSDINDFFPFDKLFEAAGFPGMSGGDGKTGEVRGTSRLELKARSGGDRDIRVRGRVKPAVGLAALAKGAEMLGVDVRELACNGRVTVTLKARGRPVARRRASVKRNCRFGARLTVSSAATNLKATARFRGNKLLAPARRSATVR